MKRPNPCVLLSHDLLYTRFILHIHLHILLFFYHGVTKDPKMTLIRYLHQKIHTKSDCNVENNVYLNLNINRIGFTGEPVTG